MWRYWRTLPANGRMAIYAGGWHADALHEDPRSARELAQFDATLRRYAWFEGQLAASGALIVKIWLNLTKSAQRRGCGSSSRTRARRGASRRRTGRASATTTGWRASRSGCAARPTSPGRPWYIVDSSGPARPQPRRGRHPPVALPDPHAGPEAQRSAGPKATKRVVPLRPAGLRRLLSLSLENKLSQPSYEKKRDKWLGRLNKVVRAAGQERRSVVWVFEGWDAAGKGGAIRRLTDAIDARDFRVIPVSKPTTRRRPTITSGGSGGTCRAPGW
jgi:polyphosphate kinase 2 (PPK2 family)